MLGKARIGWGQFHVGGGSRTSRGDLAQIATKLKSFRLDESMRRYGFNIIMGRDSMLALGSYSCKRGKETSEIILGLEESKWSLWGHFNFD